MPVKTSCLRRRRARFDRSLRLHGKRLCPRSRAALVRSAELFEEAGRRKPDYLLPGGSFLGLVAWNLTVRRTALLYGILYRANRGYL